MTIHTIVKTYQILFEDRVAKKQSLNEKSADLILVSHEV